MHAMHDPMPATLRAALDATAPELTRPESMVSILDRVLAHFGCPVGSIHRLDSSDGLLHLTAARGIPPAILPQVERIPIGKGMAGLAAQRLAPVGACNLQTDASGDVRPGAKLTEMKGALCVPMLDGTTLRGTIGLARPDEHVYSAEETATLLAIGAWIAARLPRA